MREFKEILDEVKTKRINERKIKSVPADNVIDILNNNIIKYLKKLNIDKDEYDEVADMVTSFNFVPRKFGKFIEVKIGKFSGDSVNITVNDLIDIVEKTVAPLGWFITSTKSDRNKGKLIKLAPNYGEILKQVPSKLYHVTPNKYTKSIMKKGLRPRSSDGSTHGFKYPGSNFLSLNKDSAIDMIPELSRGGLDFGASSEKEYDYALLEIDASKLRKGTKFYIDPQVKDRSAVYTFTHIPPSAIKIIKTIAQD